ncbi:MAG TPA: tetratricopeptide repeat protein [Candidatus Udaeobacter sp.]|nr:tetratricopeptide repeat protein [Candidatus Udaeobacter sp.]
MPSEQSSEVKFEIGHVLFIDIVGYSKLLINEQGEQIQKLKEIVRGTEQFRLAEAEGKLLRLPTGDGGALVFRNSPEAPVLCALEITKELQKDTGSKQKPQLRLRMGIHSGPVNEVTDLNEQANIAGAGINIAQRVMDCGDAGHILLSRHVADDLKHYARWRPYLHEIGECKVKHGEIISLVNFYTEELGNPQRPQNIRGAAPAESVAVLPFVNMSADKHDEYLSDGMTEELINALARVPGLRVPGRTSCFAFKGKTEADIFRKVGDKLHVDTVLEGSVRKAGEKLRVTAQLINVSDGYHLWSEDYDGDVRDIFTFQSNVAQRVVEALQIKLGVEAVRALTKKPTENPEAHRLYLLGRYEFGKYGEAGWTSSIRYYEKALKLDPNYALAYCGLADTYAYMGGVVMPSKEAVVKEKEFAQRALELEPQLAEAHLSLACALAGGFDWRNAQVEFDRAIELNPNLAWAYEIYGWFLGGLGRLDEAIAKDEKAIELDPLNSFFQFALAYSLYHARRYDDAMVQIRRTLDLDPASTVAHHLLGCCLLWKGDTAGAIAEFQRSRIMVTGAWYQGLLGYAYAISGDRSKAEQILRELEQMAKRQYVSTTAFADIYLGLGEKEKALDWLDKSYQDQESACWYLKVDPIYDSVRSEPRFQALLKKVGLD